MAVSKASVVLEMATAEGTLATSDGNLKDKVNACAKELGILDKVKDKPLTEQVQAVAAALGLAKQIQGKPIVDALADCHGLVFGGNGAVVNRNVPMGIVMATAVPVPLTMEQQSSTELEQWIAQYPTSGGGPRPDQLNAYGWFDSSGWAGAWPLQRAAMRGEVDQIRKLCAEGHDPNVKMTPWFDSEPLGWAASLGHLNAVIALIQCGADPFRPPNKAGNDPLKDAGRERHTHIVRFLNEYKRRKQGRPDAVAGGAAKLFDKKEFRNGGPRGDQNLPCLTLCCAAPFVACPTHCLAAWGCAGPLDCLTSLPCKHIPCTPCDPNSKNPLWFCAEPLGWAASFGQLHTVMALVKNGAKPETKNASGNNTYSDAAREGHQHVLDWLSQWEAAGRPRGNGTTAPDRAALPAGRAQGCYIGACIVPVLVTTFWVNADSEDDMTASGITLCMPWSYKLHRAPEGGSTFQLRAPGQQQDWMWHDSGCCFWGSPGWWAVKVLPACK